jgi:superfamily II DNA or RNA helicase
MRERIFLVADGHCQSCARIGRQTPITMETFHVSHLRAHANGGAVTLENLEAWCARCNYAQRATDVRDTRIQPRAWQLEALDPIVAQIADSGAATLSAAPGAGKTLFAGMVFDALYDQDVVDRLVVVAPRLTIVDQWVDSLRDGLHLELKPFAAVERPGQHGVVTTYQSLAGDNLDVHRLNQRARTLLVLDEVHHLGEPSNSAWARNITELAGSVMPPDLHVAGVLNLSGTLWRSRRSERISTVRYRNEGFDRFVSEVDYNIPADRLVREGQLRAVDLYRIDGRVSVQDWANLEYREMGMADLDEEAGAALRAIGHSAAYREAFVRSVLERLEEAHRSLGRHHSKALIVAATQKDARAFRDEVDAQMRARGLSPLAELAISDEPESKAVLERFRTSTRVGVLCTVDMAGEGYDCPDIAVVGYATNKTTPMYVRQVVARAMRVSDRERQMGITIPARVVLPDITDLVKTFLEYLEPVLGDVVMPPDRPDEDGRFGDDAVDPWFGPRYNVTDIAPQAEQVSVALSADEVFSYPADVVSDFASALETANVAPSLAARILVAVDLHKRRRVFDVDPQEAGLPTTRAVSIEEECQHAQDHLSRMERWWKVNGDEAESIAAFAGKANDRAGIKSKGRPTATIEQLQRAIAYEQDLIRLHCDRSIQRVPEWL